MLGTLYNMLDWEMLPHIWPESSQEVTRHDRPQGLGESPPCTLAEASTVSHDSQPAPSLFREEEWERSGPPESGAAFVHKPTGLATADSPGPVLANVQADWERVRALREQTLEESVETLVGYADCPCPSVFLNPATVQAERRMQDWLSSNRIAPPRRVLAAMRRFPSFPLDERDARLEGIALAHGYPGVDAFRFGVWFHIAGERDKRSVLVCGADTVGDVINKAVERFCTTSEKSKATELADRLSRAMCILRIVWRSEYLIDLSARLIAHEGILAQIRDGAGIEVVVTPLAEIDEAHAVLLNTYRRLVPSVFNESILDALNPMNTTKASAENNPSISGGREAGVQQLFTELPGLSRRRLRLRRRLLPKWRPLSTRGRPLQLRISQCACLPEGLEGKQLVCEGGVFFGAFPIQGVARHHAVFSTARAEAEGSSRPIQFPVDASPSMLEDALRAIRDPTAAHRHLIHTRGIGERLPSTKRAEAFSGMRRHGFLHSNPTGSAAAPSVVHGRVRFRDSWIDTHVAHEHIIAGARLVLVLVSHDERQSTPVGYASLPLLVDGRMLATGPHQLAVWRWPADYKKTMKPGTEFLRGLGRALFDPAVPVKQVTSQVGLLDISLQSFMQPLVLSGQSRTLKQVRSHARRHDRRETVPMSVFRDAFLPCGDGGGTFSLRQRAELAEALVRPRKRPNASQSTRVIDQARLSKLAEGHSLTELSAEDKALLWEGRAFIAERAREFPTGLLQVLRTVNWASPSEVAAAREFAWAWPPIAPEHALGLLGREVTDVFVRAWAVKQLSRGTDACIVQLLLQLVQALKREANDDSPLARFLLLRALQNPAQVGQRMYWALRSEMHVPHIAPRFSVLLKCYATHVGAFRQELLDQTACNRLLEHVAAAASKAPKASRNTLARRELKKRARELPRTFSLCLSTTMRCSGIVVSKCRVMDSAKAPLFVTFANADEDAPPIQVIFKLGDDLRQDEMTLRIMDVMNTVWIKSGRDMRMNIYACCSTGDERGMIEVVQDCVMVEKIHQDQGTVAGAFRDPAIANWLQAQPGAQAGQPVQNFAASCAAYCIATFVMGIADRHTGNIMVKRDGRMFHIDFGHILGAFKSKFGIKRERSPFVFTPEMAFVVGGEGAEGYSRLIDLATQAFMDIRRHAHLLVTLFELMLPASLDEMQVPEDIQYLVNQLWLDRPDEQIGGDLAVEFTKSRKDWTRRFDNAIHNVKHQ